MQLKASYDDSEAVASAPTAAMTIIGVFSRLFAGCLLIVYGVAGAAAAQDLRWGDDERDVSFRDSREW